MCAEPGQVLGHPARGPHVLHRHGLRGPRHRHPRQVRARGRELGAAQTAATGLNLECLLKIFIAMVQF